jgi:tetratricopeptide (TPR) repeat protein
LFFDPNSTDARMALVDVYWSTGKKEAAERELVEAVRRDPKNAIANRGLAIFYMRTGRPAEAEAPLKIGATIDPTPSGRLFLADYYISNGRLDDAKALLEQIEKDPAGATQAKIRLASLGLETGDHATSYRLVDEVLAKNPKDPEALLAKGQLQLSDKKLDDALASVKSAIAQDDKSPRAQYLLGMVQVARNHLDEAETALLEAVRLNPRFTPATIELARIAVSRGENDRAISLATEALRGMPTNAAAALVIAQANVAKNNPAGAEELLHKLSAAYPDEPNIQLQVGRLAVLKNDRAKARATFERILSKNPTFLPAVESLAFLDMQDKKPGDARARVEALTKAQPTSAGARVLAARIALLDNDDKSAERELQTALQLDANNMDIYSLLGQIYVKQKRLPEATVEYQALASRQTKPAGSYTAVAALQELQGKPQEAAVWYKKALAADSNAAVAANNLAWIYANGNTELESALQLAQTAKRALPNSASVDDTLGWVYYRKGLPSLAIDSLKRCVQTDPNNPTYLYHLGMAYVQNGNRDLARQSLEKALKADRPFGAAADARKALDGLKG